MIYEPRIFQLKDGREVVLRSPTKEDALSLISYMRETAGESEYLLRTPEEVTLTQEQEVAFINGANESDQSLMICAFVDGELAGNCSLTSVPRKKIAHRGNVAIAIRKKFWNLGLGTLLFTELENVARTLQKTVLFLEYVEGNDRAKALYEKLGFVQSGARQQAHLLSSGYVSEITMEKIL